LSLVTGDRLQGIKRYLCTNFHPSPFRMNKRLIAPIASAVAIIGFFSPWMSCGMMTFSGMDLATGSGGGMGDLGGAVAGNDTGGGEPLLLIVPLAALVIIGLYLLYKSKSQLASAMIPTIIVAVLALVVMTFKYIDVQDMRSGTGKGLNESLGSLSSDSSAQSASPDLNAMMGDVISIRWGFWLTGLAFLVTIFGALQYRNSPKQPEDATTAIETPPAEVVPSSPPADASMTEDKGMG
jgi:hypothetical protein